MGVAAKCQLRACRAGKIFRRSSQPTRSPAKTMTAAQTARAASAHQPSSKKGPISNPRSRTVKIMAKSSLYQKLQHSVPQYTISGPCRANKKGVDKAEQPRYTLRRKFVSGRGAIPHWRYSPRPLPKSADPVRLRGQRYSPDARNGRQYDLSTRPVAVFAAAGRVFDCLPGSEPRERGFPIFDLGPERPGRILP